MADKLEWSGFFFNVEKFLGSTAVRRMSMSELGVYVLMLCQQWREDSRNLPDDPRAVAELITVTETQAGDVLAAWEIVRRKFVTSDHTPGRIWNIALEDTRRKQRANHRAKVEAGRTAGRASAAKRQQLKDLGVNDRSTTVQRSSTDKKRLDKKRLEEIRSEEIISAASVPPVLIFPTSGTVAEWGLTSDQVTEWQRLYVGVDIEGEARKALAWVRANGSKTAKGMPAFLVNWLNRAVKSGPRRIVGVSDTATYNAAEQEVAQQIIHANEAARYGHQR